MADTGFNTVQSRTKGVKTIHMTVKVVGASSAGNNTVTIEKGGDGVSTVTRSGTGAYTVTLRDQYVALLAAHGSVMAATAIDSAVQFVSHTLDATGKQIIFKDLAAATAIDVAVGVTRRFMITLHLKNTSAT